MKTEQSPSAQVILTAVGAWVLAIATLFASVHMIRQQVAISTMRPAFAYANDDESQWNRNDNENETVHMPTKFDVGLRIAAVAGKK